MNTHKQIPISNKKNTDKTVFNVLLQQTWIESNSTWRKLFSTPLVYSRNVVPLESMFATTFAYK